MPPKEELHSFTVKIGVVRVLDQLGVLTVCIPLGICFGWEARGNHSLAEDMWEKGVTFYL